jgi:Flp pilus assembly protein TadG
MWNGGSAASLLRRLASCRRGVVALEFALVGLAFITMTMFIVDTGLQLYTQSVMDDAARTAAHNIKTGNGASAAGAAIGTARGTAADVRTTVCNLLSLVTSSCKTSLQVYATSNSSFAVLSRVDSSKIGLGSYNNNFSAGGSNAYVLLQVALYRASVIPFSGVAGSYVVSTIMFENEL